MNAQLYFLILLVIVTFVAVGAIISSRRSYRDLCRKAMRIDLEITDMNRIEQSIKSNSAIPKREKSESTQDYIWSIARNLKMQNGGTANISEQALSDKIDNDVYQVTFQKGLGKEEYVFALAHECGHILNGDSFPNTRPDANNKSMKEQLADYAGAALLLPKDDIENFLEINKYEVANDRKKISLVKDLCKIYEVSAIAVLRRIKEIQLMKANE